VEGAERAARVDAVAHLGDRAERAVEAERARERVRR
jgi:hypothetical protein